MSSIPLVATQIQPVQIPDMVGNYERILRIKQALQEAPLRQQALQQQVQTGQQTLEAGALDNETKRRALADQKAMDAAMQQWTQPQQGASSAQTTPGAPATQGTPAPSTMPNYDDLIDLARKNGASFGTIQTLQQHVLDMKDKASTIAKNDAATGASNANATKTKNDMLINAMTGVANLPDDQLVPGLLYTAQDLAQKGLLDPPHVQMALSLAQTGDLAAIRKSLTMQIYGMGGFNTMLDDAQKKQKMQYGPTGDVADAKYRDILQRKAAGQPLSADDVNYARGYEASNAKATTTSDSLGVSGVSTSRPAGLAAAGGAAGVPSLAPTGVGAPSPQGVPGAKDSVVDLIGQYRYNPAELTRLVGKHPDILTLVQQKYPGFDETTYQAKNKLVQGYTSGPQSREINAYNTTMGHLSVLDAAVSALNNNDVRALNSIGNAIGAGTGNDAQTVFKAIVHRVGPEITSAYVAGGGGEAERIANANDFNENLAPGQLRTNIRTSAKLLDSKVEALEQQYSNTVGRDDFAQRFITPHAQAARAKLVGGNGGTGGSGTVMMRSPNGQTKAVPVDQVDHYKQRGAVEVQ